MNDEGPQDLKERLREFALRIVRMYAALPKTTEAQVLGKQVLRSGTSVGANHREATRARSTAEFVAKLGDCLKEFDEPSEVRQTTRSRCPKGERGALINPTIGSTSSSPPASSPQRKWRTS